MTIIRGKYVYDMVSGKTIGKSTSDINQDEKQDYNHMYARATTAGYWRDTITYSLLKGVECPENTGTVEQLSFEQIVNLFLQGNMIVDELKIGLEAKGAKDIKVTEKDGMTTVTFQYDNKNYTLQCATDAAASQIDDVTDEITDESMQAFTIVDDVKESGHFDPDYKLPDAPYGYHYEMMNLDGLVNDPLDDNSLVSNGGLVVLVPDNCSNADAFWDYKYLMPIVNEYFGFNFKNTTEMWQGIFDEQIFKEMQQHPEIFHIFFSDMDTSDGWIDYHKDEMALEEFFLQNGSFRVTPEEQYSLNVTAFGELLEDSICKYEPYRALKCDGQNVEFTENTVKSLMGYFDCDSVSGGELLIQLLGITADDDEAKIWEKINYFCKNLGSADGKTISLEKYYLACGKKSYANFVDQRELVDKARESELNIQKNLFNNDPVDFPSESELWVQQLNYKINTEVVSKIDKSNLPMDACVYDEFNWNIADSIDKLILSECFYQIGDTDEYLLKPEIAQLIRKNGGIFTTQDFEMLRFYYELRGYIAEYNWSTGDFNSPLNSIEDLLKMPKEFGIEDVGPFNLENFFTYYGSIMQEMFSPFSSEVPDTNDIWEYIGNYLDIYADQSTEEAAHKSCVNNFVKCFTNGNMSEEVFIYLVKTQGWQITVDSSTSIEISESNGNRIVSGIQLPLPETGSAFYTLEELEALGIDRSEVEVAISASEGSPTKYRVKTESLQAKRDELLDELKAQQNSSLENIKTVNIEALFANSGSSVNADYLLGAEILLTNDDSVKKLVLTIQNAIEKYSDYLPDYNAKKSFVNRILSRLNNSLGIKNTTPPSLSKEALEKLNDMNIFDEINNIVNSDSFRQFTVNRSSMAIPDGELNPENFEQGELGDCGLVATVVSIVNTDTGKRLLKESIEINGDTIKFHFKGIGLTYEFSIDELYDFIENEKHSNGDIDIIAIEYAFTKLVADAKSGKYYDLLVNRFHCGKEGREDLGILYGISPDDVMFALVPSAYALKNDTGSMVDNFNNNPYVATATIGPGASTTCIDGTTFYMPEIDSDGDGHPEPHAFAIVAMTEETISLVNPWYPTTVYTMTWEAFSELSQNDYKYPPMDFNPIFDNDEFEKYITTSITYPDGKTSQNEGSTPQFSVPTLVELFNMLNNPNYKYGNITESMQNTFEEFFGYGYNASTASTGGTNASTPPSNAPAAGDDIAETPETPKTETGTETVEPPADNNVDTNKEDDNIDEDDFYASLAKKIDAKAKTLGYEKGDDGNYYFNEGNNIYLCLWNYWTNSFDKYLIATEEDEVQLETNSKGDFKAAENTLESLFAEANLMARKYEMTPTDDMGVFELNNERYVYDIKKKTFVKESDAIKNNVRTWVQVYSEAVKLALELGYKPSSMAFCIFEDSDGNKFKYDADKQKFIEY